MTYYGFMTRVLKNPNSRDPQSIGLNFFRPPLIFRGYILIATVIFKLNLNFGYTGFVACV